MLKHVTKLAMEIVPSVVATILGAYIVNHYINAKPDTPAAAVATAAPTAADPLKAAIRKIDLGKADAKTDAVKADAKPAETSAEISGIPASGIKAKGISEKSVIEKSVTDKGSGEKASAEKASAEKASEAKSQENKAQENKSQESKPTETASLPPEKAHALMTPKPAPRSAEVPAAQDEHRDATDLARAAIERLRASDGRVSEASRGDQSKIVTAAPQVSPVRPLPPAINVSTPLPDTAFTGGNPAYTGSVQAGNRLTPPADIPEPPPARPIDLRADRGGDPSLKDQMSNVAQDMGSALKSVFHSVLPK